MHATLKEQIQSHLSNEFAQSPEISQFLDIIDATYHEFDSDLVLLEQHMMRNEEDLHTLNTQLQSEANKHNQAVEQIKGSLSQLNIDSEAYVNDRDLLSISEFLSGQIKLRQQSETELRKAKDEAEIAAKSKTEFLATMSHEIRTPLNGVVGMASLLHNTELDGDQRRYLETIQSCCHSLMNLVNDILDVSKFDAGKIQLERTPFSPRSSIEQTLQVVAERAQTKNLQLVSYISPDVPEYLIGDPGRIHQILLNLLSNAVKFTGEGEIIINASQSGAKHQSVKHGSSKRFWITFTIKDSGIGISKSQQKKLFQPFMQADSTTTRKYGGTGLGLTLCKQLASMMGGSIDVYSKPNCGSEFSVTLPLRLTPTSDQPPWITTPLPAKRIMLIEDNKASAKALHAQLEHWGLNIYTATRSDNALKLLRKGKFDALIIDNNINKKNDFNLKDGVSLLDKIRSYDGALSSIPALMLFNLVEKPNTETFENNRTLCLSIPLESHQLYNKLSQLLHNKITSTDHSVFQTQKESHWIPNYELRILVVEDDLVNQEISSMMLKELNCHVDIANNGLEAVNTIKRNLYDVVFMDCQMPEMDGYEATQLIRSQGNSKLPIIALTANVMPKDKALCIESGMNDYLTKPIKRSTLSATLKKWAPKNQPTSISAPPSEKPVASSQTQGQSVSGIVFTQGLEMMGGKVPRYIKLLKLAIEQHGSSPANIEKAIAKSNFDEAQKLAHSLKSVGANIGATQLSILAFSIEHQIRESAAAPLISLQDVALLKKEWKTVKAAIDRYISEHQ